MRTTYRRLSTTLLLGLAAGSGGCVAAAAGAGAAGAIYITERGAESTVAAPVSRTFDAARQAFQALGITETKTGSEQDGSIEKRSLEGKTSDRDVSVDLRSEGSGTHVNVVAKKTAVTWDKDFARQILNKVVELAK